MAAKIDLTIDALCWRSARTTPRILAATALLLGMGVADLAEAAMLHPEVVQKAPAAFTPELVATESVKRPRVEAIAQIGATIYAGGLFMRVALPAGGPSYARDNFVAFDATNGTLKSLADPGYSDPVFDGPVIAIAALGSSLFVGGQFMTVNGVSRPRLAKIDANTGAVDTAFNAKFKGGRLWDLDIWDGPNGSSPRLIVGGSQKRKLMALDPDTGADTGYINLGIADPIPNAWGGVAVYNAAINPAGTKLVATGNFRMVGGESRMRLFMVDLTGASATLDPWYYPGFAKDCSATHPRRIAYLQGVDFSPDGTYFVVAATGQIPKDRPADIWPVGSATYHTVCDAAGRFDLANDQSPVWINYTGGDSMWSVSATGAAVYVQGHFVWLDNPFGFASGDGGGAVERLGIGAIDPEIGKALPWNPKKPAAIGGKAFLATPAGLWIGSDSVRFNGKHRRGIAFAPLP